MEGADPVVKYSSPGESVGAFEDVASLSALSGVSLF